MSAGQRVRFGAGGEGVLFLRGSTEPAPAVIVLHERYGLVKHTLDLAAKLAVDGYVALAPDLLARWQGDREALARGDVRVTLPDDEVARSIFDATDFLKTQPRVQPHGVVLMGICQSGRYPLVVASQREDIAAIVVFYGAAQASDWQITTEQPLDLGAMVKAIAAPALFVFGEGDHVISLADVLRLRGALEAGRRSYRIRVFPDVPHGWLNDTCDGRRHSDRAG